MPKRIVVQSSQTFTGYKSATYSRWSRMKTRCLNPNNDKFKYYGGRGIKVCEEWLRYDNFLRDMGPCPTPEHSLDRWPDQNGNYEKSNCRWATRVQQMRNTRDNIKVMHNGEERLLVEIAEQHNLPYFAVHKRYVHGWPHDRLFEPIRPHKAYKPREPKTFAAPLSAAEERGQS